MKFDFQNDYAENESLLQFMFVEILIDPPYASPTHPATRPPSAASAAAGSASRRRPSRGPGSTRPRTRRPAGTPGIAACTQVAEPPGNRSERPEPSSDCIEKFASYGSGPPEKFASSGSYTRQTWIVYEIRTYGNLPRPTLGGINISIRGEF